MEKETIGNAELYCGDCAVILPQLEPVDLILTDPPYGVLDEAWDKMNKKELARFTMGWLAHAVTAAPNMITFFGELTRDVIAPMLNMVYPEVRQLVWHKQGGDIADNKLFYAFESIYYCHQGETWEVCEPKGMEVARHIREARERAGLSKGGVDMLVRGKKTGLCYRWEEAACLPTDEQIERMKTELKFTPEFENALAEARAAKAAVMEAAKEMAKQNAARATDVFTFSPPPKKQHPCEKPTPLLERLIMAAPENPVTICDPFMGSGSTGVAAMNLEKRFIGIERERKYFDIACERISQAQAQGRLAI